MAVENEQVNYYLRVIADASQFSTFANSIQRDLQNLGAVSAKQVGEISRTISAVGDGSVTAAKGFQELNTIINGINPNRLRELSNLGFDRAGLEGATKQLGQISALLTEIQSKQNAIVRTASGLGLSSRVTGNAGALYGGGQVPLSIERTGQSGNAALYSITSSLGTTVARGQKEAAAAGNAALIAELTKLRVGMLSDFAVVASGTGPAKTAVPTGDTKANTNAITANTAALSRETQALNRLTDAVTRQRQQPAITAGTPPRLVQPSGPFSPPSGALYYVGRNVSALASSLNVLIGRGSPQGITGSPATVRPQSAFAVDANATALPLGAYTPNIAELQAVVAARKEIAALDAAEASRKSGVTRAEAIRVTRDANETILQQKLSSNPIVDTVSPYIGPTAYSTLLQSGRIRGIDAARIPEEGLAALGLTPDRPFLRQQGFAAQQVPDLGDYRAYAPAGQLGFADADRRAQLQRTVNAAEDTPLVNSLYASTAIQRRNVRIAQEIARAYERIGTLEAQRLAALQQQAIAAINSVAFSPRPLGEAAGRFPTGPSFYPPAVAAPPSPPPALASVPRLPGGGVSQSTPLPQTTLQLFEEIRRALDIARSQAAQIRSASGAARGQLIGEFAQARGVRQEMEAILGSSSLRTQGQVLPPTQQALTQAGERYIQQSPNALPQTVDDRVRQAAAAVQARITSATNVSQAEDQLAATERRVAAILDARTALPAGGAPRAITSGGAGGIYGTGYVYQTPSPPPRPPFIGGSDGITPPPPSSLPAVRAPSSVLPYTPLTNGAYNIGSGPFFTQTGFGTPPPGGGGFGAGGGFLPPPPGGVGASPGGFWSGWWRDFEQGFKGRQGKGAAEQIGQVAKFSILYGAAYTILSGVAQGVRLVITQAIEFQDSLSSLALATGESKESIAELGSTLGGIATAVGFAPGVGVEAGAKAIGIFGLQDADPAIRDYQAAQAAKVATTQAFLAGSDPNQTVANLGAIASAYELSPEAQKRVSDLDVFFGKATGVGTGATLETLAQTGTLAESAGFSLEEAQALSAIVQQRTGQTPAATAGLLSQFYGRAGDPQLRDQIAALGIDVTGSTFAEQIKELAKLPQDNPQVRNALENSFGRGRGKGAVGNVIEALGPQGQATQLVAAAAAGEATGASDDALALKLESISGQLKVFVGKLQDLAVNLGKAGLLEVFGVAVKSLEQFVEFLNNILGPFSRLDGALRLLIVTAIALAAAQKAGVLGSVAGALQTRGGFGALGTIRGPGAPLAGPAISPFRAGLKGALSYAGPIAAVTAAIGIVDTIGQMNANANEYAAVVEQGNGALAANNEVFSAATLAAATTYQGIQSNAEEQIDSILKESNDRSTFLGISLPGTSQAELQGTTNRDSQIESIQADKDFAEFAETLAVKREAQASRAAGDQVFTDPNNAESVGQTLELLAASGVSATESMHLLSTAIFGIDEGGKKAALAIDKQTVATTLAGQLGDRATFFGSERIPVDKPGATGDPSYILGQNIDDGSFSFERLMDGNLAGKDSTSSALSEFASGEFGALPGVAYSPDYATEVNPLYDAFGKNQLEIQGIISANLPKKVGKDGEIPVKFYKAMIDQIVALIPEAAGRENEIQSVLEYLVGQLNLANTAPEGGYSAQAVKQQIEGLNISKEKQLGALVPGDTTGQKKVLSDILKRQRRALKGVAVGEDVSGIIDLIDQTNYELIDLKLQESERLRLAAQSGKSDAQIARIGARYAKRDLATVVKSGSIERIVSIMDQSNKAAIRDVLRTLQLAVDVRRAALQKAKELAAAIAGLKVPLLTATGGLDPAGGADASTAVQEKAQRRLERALENQEKAIAAAERSVTNNTYQYPDGKEDPLEDEGPTQAQIDAARAVAEATRRGGAIGTATASLQSAKADLDAAEAGTVEYYNALGAYYQAQRDLSQAIRDYKVNQYLAREDITDPVVQATAELRAAKAQLRYDKNQGASADQILADQQAIREAQASRQQTAFDQWLSDLQTAESLDRIGSGAYIRHLERRQKNLEAIKNRTRQQQDQLDAVDQALKAAQESVSGLFNIGDIKVPTPYEVRRFIEQQQATNPGYSTPGTIGPSINNTNSNNKTDIRIDGADTAFITRLLRDLLGNNAIKSTATKTGKR